MGRTCTVEHLVIESVAVVAQSVKNLPTMQKIWVWFLGQKDLLEKTMAPHSSVRAWRTPQTTESGRLQSMGSKE